MTHDIQTTQHDGPQQGEIILYQPDETVRLERLRVGGLCPGMVRLEDDTVWLTQQQMAELFQTTRNNITLHIGNIFKEGELEESSVRKESLLTASDGKRYRTKFYNLDVIISVGYRVKSQRGTKFRQWANKIIKEYLLRGYTINLQLQQMQQLYQQQYGRNIEVKEYNNRFHDRFLILDDALYHFGASFKDLGKRLFAFELMGIDKSIILSQL
jgi:hypothetical protein